jgi:hypothetical protein
MRQIQILLVLVLAGACTREPYTVCFGPSDCKDFRSAQHYEAWNAAEHKKQKEDAAGFPDDFRDIVAIVLKEYLKSNVSEFENTRDQYFVSIFGDDLDGATQSKLLELGITTEPSSKYVESRREQPFQDEYGTYLKNWDVYVSSIERLGDSSYNVEFGYSCGQLCAGHFRYRVKRAAGRWLFISEETLWYS